MTTSGHDLESFECPTCGVSREFSHELSWWRRARSLLSADRLFGVLICRHCQGRVPVEKARCSGELLTTHALRTAVTDVLAGMTLSDGGIHAAEMMLNQRVLEALEIPEQMLEAKLDAHAFDASDPDRLLARLRRSEPFLDDKGKSLVLETAFHLARSDEHFDVREERFLREVARALGIPPGQFEIVLDLTSEEALFDALTDYLEKIKFSTEPDSALRTLQ